MKRIKTKDFSVSNENFELHFNEDLDLYKTHPIPKDVSKYYESENYISHSDAKSSLIEKLYQQVKKITIGQKTNLLSEFNASKGKLVLDIGCGTGSFLEVAEKKGWNGVGVEPNFSARKLAKEKGISCFENETELRDQKFDVISMWHVLEHVPNINDQFKSFKKLLSPNGTLIIAVPNYKSWDAKFYKSHWAAFDVPRHLWHFSETAIKKIGAQHNFELIKTKPMWFDSFYVSLLSEKYKYNKTNYFRAFGVGLLSNLKAIKNSEFSSKIYILRQKN